MTPRLRVAIAASALVVLAFALGRYTAHAPTVKDSLSVATVATQTETKVAKVDVAKHEVATKDTDTTVRTVTSWLPAVPAVGGCPAVPAHVEQEVVRETKVVAARTADTKREANSAIAKTGEMTSNTVELHTVERSPADWNLSLLAGLQRGSEQLVPSLPGHAVIGAAVSRRLVGPVTLGLFVSTAGQAGASLGLQF